MEGWIKLHRKILDCDLWNSGEPFGVREAWIDLLLMVNHADKKILFDGEPYTVKCGQKITSIRKLAERWHWSKERVARYLKTLEGEEMLTKVRHKNGTLLTIVNYGKYQGQCDTDKDTDKDTNKDTDTPQTRMIKNDKNVKNIYGEFHHVRLTDQEHEKLLAEYGQTTEELIRYLDEYIEMKGYKAKNHYLCIKKWVVNAVKEKKGKKGFNAGEGSSDADALIKMLEG